MEERSGGVAEVLRQWTGNTWFRQRIVIGQNAYALQSCILLATTRFEKPLQIM